MLEVDRVDAGSVETDEDVFRRLYPRLRRFAAAWTTVADDPDDLVQEALARTLARHSLTDLDDPLAYLQRAVANLAKNTYRARARRSGRRADPVDGRDVYPSDLADLERLRPEERAALYLVDVEGVSVSAAALILACSTSTVSGRLKRGRRLLEQVVTKEQQRG